MYPGDHAVRRADQPCVVMADGGEILTYREFEERTNRLAHLLRRHGVRRRDHIAIFMENHERYLECCGAAERAGLYYTCVNSHLLADDVAYIVDDSSARVLIVSARTAEVARQALARCPDVELALIVDGDGADPDFAHLPTLTAEMPSTPIDDEALGTALLYSSGTTGRPKRVLRELPDAPPADQFPLFWTVNEGCYREGMVYLSPAPLYHSAPQVAVNLAIRSGGTVVVMERFDAERFLQLVEEHRVTHCQMVPTMFVRLLKLPPSVRARYDVSSLECVVHSAAPCPVPVKEQMIEWWGPIIREFYGATESFGFTVCDSDEWLAHRGTVGRPVVGDLHIRDDDGRECAPGEVGTVWFASQAGERTAGDIGYVDDDGYLYLTDRAAFMIISGGVNIYPQATENVLVTHPLVADAAVIGVPNEDLGEEVKAVVELVDGTPRPDDLERELIEFCRARLPGLQCPRSVDVVDRLPRLSTGKLYKHEVRAGYWPPAAGSGGSRR